MRGWGNWNCSCECKCKCEDEDDDIKLLNKRKLQPTYILFVVFAMPLRLNSISCKAWRRSRSWRVSDDFRTVLSTENDFPGDIHW